MQMAQDGKIKINIIQSSLLVTDVYIAFHAILKIMTLDNSTYCTVELIDLNASEKFALSVT